MIYDSTMHTMSGVLVGALIFNAMMRPVDPKHYTTTPKSEEESVTVVDTTLTSVPSVSATTRNDDRVPFVPSPL